MYKPLRMYRNHSTQLLCDDVHLMCSYTTYIGKTYQSRTCFQCTLRWNLWKYLRSYHRADNVNSDTCQSLKNGMNTTTNIIPTNRTNKNTMSHAWDHAVYAWLSL